MPGCTAPVRALMTSSAAMPSSHVEITGGASLNRTPNDFPGTVSVMTSATSIHPKIHQPVYFVQNNTYLVCLNCLFYSCFVQRHPGVSFQGISVESVLIGDDTRGPSNRSTSEV